MEAASSVTSTDVYLIVGTIAVGLLIINFMKQRSSSSETPLWTSFIPFIGVLVDFGKNPVEFIKEGRRRYGDAFTAYILGRKMTFLTHPRTHAVFFKAADEQLSPREVYRFVTPVFGPGIVYDAPPEIMAEQLKFVSNALTVARFRTFVSIFERETKAFLLEQYKGEGKMDIFKTLSELTILTASRCLLGREIRENLKESRFAELYHDLEAGLNPLVFFLPWLPTPGAKTRDRARAEIVSLFASVIKQRRQAAGSGPKNDDILQVLMDAEYKSGDVLTDDNIVGILLGLLFAGQHTSAITSTWTALSILSNPRVMAKVVAEQKEVMSKHNNELTYESVKDMVYLENCMKEALRMFPPLIMLMRQVKQDRVLPDGKIIPAGNIICVSPAAASRAEDVYKNPDVYEPERFLPGRAEDKDERFPNAFIGFGGGMHKCIGENFAYLQVKTVLSIFFRSFDAKLESPFPKVNYDSMVAGPVHSTPIIVSYKRVD